MRRSDGSTRRDDEVLTCGSKKRMNGKSRHSSQFEAIADNPRRSIDLNLPCSFGYMHLKNARLLISPRSRISTRSNLLAHAPQAKAAAKVWLHRSADIFGTNASAGGFESIVQVANRCRMTFRFGINRIGKDR